MGMVAAILGVAMPNLVRAQTISSQANDRERYSAGITILSTSGPKRGALCNRGALSMVHGSGGILMSSRSDVVMLQARRNALLSDAKAAARRRMVCTGVFLLALIAVGVLVFNGVIATPWLALPGVALALVVAASFAASSAANTRIAEVEKRLDDARQRESESVETILARRLEARRTKARAAIAPSKVETEEFESQPIKVTSGWTPMPVPKPLYALQPMEQKRNVDISAVAAQFDTRDEAREIYRPRHAQGIIDGMSSAEAAGDTPIRLDVDTAIDRRRAASF